MVPKLIVKEIWQAKNCGNLPFVEEDDSKVAYDYNKGNNIEDGIVHEGLPFRFYRPQIDDKRQYSGKDIESQEIHWFLSFFEANIIFAPSKKKSETISNLSLSNIQQKSITQSAICQAQGNPDAKHLGLPPMVNILRANERSE